MIRLRRIAVLLALVASLAAIRPGLAQTQLRFSLDWRFEGPAAIFLAAADKGYFRQEGLEVTFEAGNGSRDSVLRVASGAFDAGFGDVNTLIRYRDDNPAVDVKAVMMVYDKPAFAIVGRRSRGITDDPKSLEGKRLAAPAADASYAQWPIFRALNGIDAAKMIFENVGFPVREPMLASGEVDGVFGFAQSSFVALKARGVPLDDIVLMQMADHGLALYGNAVIVSPKFMAEKPEAVRGLLRAILRSIRDSVANPALAVQSVLKRNEIADPAVELERLSMVLDRNILTGWVKANGFGGIDRERWGKAVDQIAANVALKDKARAGDAFSDRFLPPREERMP